MLKKSLLASIALVALNPIQASQPTHVQHAPAAAAAPATTNCPPCPCGGVQGWVLIPAGAGAPCKQGEEEVVKPHHHHPAAAAVAEPEPAPAPEPAVQPKPKPSLHPARTSEQEKLELALQPITPHIFLRANPNSPTPKKKEGEWGKALDNKVYFRHLGNWVYDPSVNATTDIVVTGVKARISALNAAAANKPAAKPAGGAAATTAGAGGGTSTTSSTTGAGGGTSATATTSGASTKPATPSGYKGKRYNVATPDALGTTNRPNPVTTDPTKKGAPAVPAQGTFNQAQTNVEQRNAAREVDANQFISPTPAN